MVIWVCKSSCAESVQKHISVSRQTVLSPRQKPKRSRGFERSTFLPRQISFRCPRNSFFPRCRSQSAIAWGIVFPLPSSTSTFVCVISTGVSEPGCEGLNICAVIWNSPFSTSMPTAWHSSLLRRSGPCRFDDE